MSADELKAAEKRGYSKGYDAGRRRKARGISAERAAAERAAFRRRVFLAVLPECLKLQGWVNGQKKPITNLTQRTDLAWSFADEALKRYY